MSEPQESAGSSELRKPALVENAVSRVRQEPMKAVGWAFVTGLFLSVFPIGRIVSALVGLGLVLLRPALVLFGMIKVLEGVERRRKSERTPE